MDQKNPPRVTLAMTGASGAQYGLRLLECLVAADKQIFFLISKAARVVLATEMDIQLGETAASIAQYLNNHCQARPGQIQVFDQDDWMSPVASGSGAPGTMVICPCSIGTLSAIACGLTTNLTQRAAMVALKERRQLIIVPRETPYSEVILENMLKLTRMGSIILPASPGFYNKPKTVRDLIDFMVARVLDHLGIAQQLTPRWGEDAIFAPEFSKAKAHD